MKNLATIIKKNSTNGNKKFSRKYLLEILKEVDNGCKNTKCENCIYRYESNCLTQVFIDTICDKEDKKNEK